ncbi:hypothetical protein [Colwellia sp. MB3u-55]|uniref:hypothetical protein n=1 Tax=Colwellia sp. MB3u-55 TaxID=2759810 RepID=UPI0015F44F08|nr:hypothetical protein [Colwellia sp. MB3u-55]MBA6250813.1 hypothetical protein [Colwellia sp. MB3u-55]
MKTPEASKVSKSIFTFVIGFIILFVGIGLNKIFGLVDFGVIITFFGFFVCVSGLLIYTFAVIKSWFS